MTNISVLDKIHDLFSELEGANNNFPAVLYNTLEFLIFQTAQQNVPRNTFIKEKKIYYYARKENFFRRLFRYKHQ
jgi:hypothetical protein